MLRSFLTITIRVLWRNKVTTFVNIFSLAMGIATLIFTLLYVQREFSYDRFNVKYDRIYRLEGDGYGRLPPVIATYVKERVPEVEHVVRLAGAHRKPHITYLPDDNPQSLKNAEVNFFWADSTVFNVFTLPFIEGDPRTALKDPFSAVLTESTVLKLFGKSDPMSKTVKFIDHDYTVTGIIRDVQNSHIEIDALFSQESISKVYPDRNLNEMGPNSWLWSATYLLFREGFNENLVQEKINTTLSEINDGQLFDIEFKRFNIRPLKEIYLQGFVQNLQYGLHGNMKLIQLFLAAGVFIMVLACMNYVNLTTARSIVRTKEISVKKVAGSSISLLRYQLIVESIIVSLISLVVALTIIQIFLPVLNAMTIADIKTNQLNQPAVLGGVVASVILIGAVSGLYPAFYLTSGRPFGSKKGETTRSEASLRALLMTIQFAISVVMIIGMIANLRQTHFLRSADLGFRKDHVITIVTPADIPEEYSLRETFKERLRQHVTIMNVAYSAGNPGAAVPTTPIEYEGIKRNIGFLLIDEDYLDVMGMEMATGRSFLSDRPSEKFEFGKRQASILLNETAAKELAMDSPLGEVLYYAYQHGSVLRAEVIGVVKDFHFRSLHHQIEPLMIFWTPPMSRVNIKISSSNVPATLRAIEKEWKSVYGPRPFDYAFLDESFNRQYRNDEQLTTVIGYFTALAVIVACLGLFALSSFMVSRRTKEIGVRKALGASAKTIYAMLSWEFLKWIFLAVAIACPVALYLVKLWLEGFAYHINISADIFIITALIAIGVALVTVTWQSLKAAYANPVKALRYE